MIKPTNSRAVKWLSAGHFTTDAFSGFLNPIMPFIAAKIGISMGVAALLMSISQLFSQLLQPIFGFFADNILKRGFIFWGLLFSTIFFPLTGVANNVYWLGLFIILGSLGVSIFHPQSIGFVIRFTEKDFTKNMGIFLSLGSIGYSFGPLISAAITQYLSLEKMPVLSIFGIVLALLMFVCVPKISNTDVIENKEKDIVKVFKTILSNKQVLILIIISIMKALISSSCAILLPFLWKDTGHNPIYIGMALFWFMFAGGIGSLVSPKFEKILGTKQVIYLSMLSMPVLMCIFVFLQDKLPIVALVDFVLMAFVLMLATPITMVLAQKELPQYKSIIGGFLNGFCWGVVGVLLSGLGFMAQKFGILQMLFIAGFVPAFSAYLVKYLNVEEN
ncbi:MAG: MFS transporter [Candidatus Gastranaerophilaceae bacterium]